MKKSPLLMPLPSAVVTEIRPEPVPGGTVVKIEVPVEELIAPRPTLKRRSFLPGVVSKFVPLTITAVPRVPMVGAKLVIVCRPLEDVDVTINGALLAADPGGAVTPIGPVVAPDGTVATIWVAVDEFTVVGTPLNVTAI